MFDKEKLKALDMSEKEIDIYLFCMINGSSPIQDIAKNTGIGRTLIYDIGEKMIQKGFIKKTNIKNKIYFFATPFKKVLANKQNQLKELESMQETFVSLHNKKNAPRIHYFDGMQAIKEMNDTFEFNGGTILSFTDEDFYTLEHGIYAQKNISKRTKNKTSFKSIATLTTASITSQQKDTAEQRETRLLSKEIYNPKVLIGLYKNTVTIVNHKNKSSYIIEDTELFETLKDIFNLIWKGGRFIN